MLAVQFKLLFPSFLLHLILTTAAAAGVAYAAIRFKPEWRIPWALPVAIGAMYSLYSCAGTLISLHQNELLVRSAQAQRADVEGQKLDPKMQLKQDFLRTVDDLAGAPDKINEGLLKQLFEKAGPLFPNGATDREQYAKAVLDVYTCQQVLYEDALASFKFKKGVKSEDRERCEKADGRFFNRERLVPAEVATQNAQLIDTIAARKPLDGPEGKKVELTEAMIRGSLEGQIKKSEAVRRIFASIPESKTTK